MEKETLNNCTFTKTILLLIVILYHSCVFWTGEWWETKPLFSSMMLGTLAEWLNSFHIYTFTLVSGYIFAHKVYSGAYCEFVSFLINKIKRLIIPYLFVAITWLIPITVFLFHPPLQKIINAYFLCINPEQLWFLWMLFGVFLIVWPVRKLIVNNPIVGFLFSLILYAIGTGGKHLLSNVFCVFSACQYFIFFFIGMWVKKRHKCGQKCIIDVLPWYLWFILHLTLFIVIKLLPEEPNIVVSILSILLNLLLHLFGAIMAWTVLQTLGDKLNWKNNKVFKSFSSLSMPMYLFHQQIVYFTIILFDGKLNPLLHASINLVMSLFVSYMISRVLMKWKITRFLIGEK